MLTKNWFLIFVPALILSAPAFGGSTIFGPERAGNSSDDPVGRPKDLSGRSPKCPRVRAVHSSNIADEGASAYLLKADPWLGYQRGRELFLRDFSKFDGVFGEAGKQSGVVLEDESTKFIIRDNVASCAICHNIPLHDAGAGGTMFKNGGSGRNSIHLYGDGQIEMLGWQLRLKMLELADKNRNGFVDKGEADNLRARVDNIAANDSGEHISVDFGEFGDKDGDGRPDLNSVCFIWYVDKDGKRISWARSLDYEGVAGYNFELQVFGWGHGRSTLSARIPITSTLRAFSQVAFDTHLGMQAFDPTLNEEPNADGLALVSQLGAQQFFSGRTRDRAAVKDSRGISLDDPDRDGILEEMTEGDMDLVEHFLLNHPQPAETYRTDLRKRGREVLTQSGCVQCHVPDWKLEAEDKKNSDYTKRYTGDRRFFNLELSAKQNGKLEGKLQLLKPGSSKTLIAGGSKNGALLIKDVFSDFKHHDLGPDFHQMQFDGSVIKAFRTPPLWGVGSSGPYGHDGASMDLDEVIRRHGGEAQEQKLAYEKLPDIDRLSLLEFLRGLVLYSVDDLPCDLDGDGKISDHYLVAGKDTGVERLNPEWLFKVPGCIEGEITNPQGQRVRSFALTNVKEAYGADLKFLKASTQTGFPDIRLQQRTKSASLRQPSTGKDANSTTGVKQGKPLKKKLTQRGRILLK